MQVPLLEEAGVVCISAPYATAAMVEARLDRPGVAHMFEIEGASAGMMIVFVPENGRVAGQKIKDISIPDECVVAAIVRDGQFVVPRGGTEIKAGNHVIFAGPSAAVQKTSGLFRATEAGT